MCKLFNRLNNSRGRNVAVCTDFSGKELHRQVGMVKVVTTRSLGGVMVSTLVMQEVQV